LLFSPDKAIFRRKEVKGMTSKTMGETLPTLLVVDDESANIELLFEALGVDYRVRVAVDGASALASVQKQIPDLVLLDVMMPGMDGFEVCRRMKEEPALREIPVIFLTALSDPADEARGLALGAVDYIAKPISPPIVKARIRNHLELKAHRTRLETLLAERTRELARAYDRLRKMDHLKSDFLRMISPELRTPANGILGIGELIGCLLPDSEESRGYRDLFRRSEQRLLALIEDATMIADLETPARKDGGAISLSVLLDDVMVSLDDVAISVDETIRPEGLLLWGNHALLKRALETVVRLAACFRRDRRTVHITGHAEALDIRLRIALDALPLSAEQAAVIFDIDSSVRSASVAEPLGLAPVAARRIVSAYGGEMRLVKGEGHNGYLETVFVREP
jgi:CheY-like chemotaxis protein